MAITKPKIVAALTKQVLTIRAMQWFGLRERRFDERASNQPIEAGTASHTASSAAIERSPSPSRYPKIAPSAACARMTSGRCRIIQSTACPV